MTGQLGASFAPTTDQATQNQARPPELLPQAIQILSLRLPRLLGAQAPANPALLGQGPQGPSPVVSAVVDSVVRSVLGSMPPPAPSAPGAVAGGPSRPPASAPTESAGVQQAVQTWTPGKPSLTYQRSPDQSEAPRFPFAAPQRPTLAEYMWSKFEGL